MKRKTLLSKVCFVHTRHADLRTLMSCRLKSRPDFYIKCDTRKLSDIYANGLMRAENQILQTKGESDD